MATETKKQADQGSAEWDALWDANSIDELDRIATELWKAREREKQARAAALVAAAREKYNILAASAEKTIRRYAGVSISRRL
ncbi:MAG: hypothetical protein KGL39_24035 [Patescibacteria group bacterium]|nr:hypothetical protein [Patescibacteria group bacterium]